MQDCLRLSVLALVVLGFGSLQAQKVAGQSQVAEADYLEKVKPLLRDRCYACHGALKQKAHLRLDTVEFLRTGGDSGPAMVPGNPQESVILERVCSQDPSDRMPPEHEGEPLSAEQVEVLRAWIAAGAAAPASEQAEADPRDHWAFRPIVRPEVPKVCQPGWVRNPVDAFIARQHEARGLTPQPEADRLVLLRRLSFDIVGLPPDAGEITSFKADQRPDWYERAVDRLLDDPRHGERWGRHWMDIWRYSDWWGLGDQLRNSQKHIWHWRDWIIESLNADTPYDEMVRLMLAADEIAPTDLGKLRASGYLARNYFLFNRNQWMDETVEHVGKGLLGLTINCAKCHDHKYDPISQSQYYQLRAFFEPYHVRMDVLPGQADLNQDGLPRAFDGAPDTPTYRFIRGQENQPDQSKPLSPGVPEFLGLKLPDVEPVNLPAEAWEPGRRPWVSLAYRTVAERKVEQAKLALSAARETLAGAQKHEVEIKARPVVEPPAPSDNPAPGSISERFEAIDATRWRIFGGEWTHTPGRLHQKRDGGRAVLRLIPDLPQDFEATLKFTILGGEPWRSVGISFDANQPDPSIDAGAGTSEQSVYVSAYSGGSKVQAAFQRDGQWNYPDEGKAARPIELNREYTLKIQVRGTLVNATLNGEPVIAWRSPLERRPGRLQITLFHALAVLQQVAVGPLPASVGLREPGSSPAAPATPEAAARAVEESKLALEVAEVALAVAETELKGFASMTVALAAPGNSELKSQAARTERELAVGRARLATLEAALKLFRATDDKKAEAEKAVVTAKAAMDEAQKKLESPGEQFSLPMGAQWTATRFLDSTKDDPTVTFPPQSTGRRKALAEWITDRRNPLAARVAVNHIWARHFGSPLAPTLFDLGRKGIVPTNPELLDWLAAELMESEWSVKHIHRLILESATYRMSSATSGAEANLAQDPDNQLLWRRQPIRLESQAVRDTLLSLSSELDQVQGGPPVAAAMQTLSKRRSLYFFHSNNERNLLLTTFDEALVKECYRRDQSIVPQQALALSNSQLVLDSLRPIAESIGRQLPMDSTNDHEFIKLAFSMLLGTEPTGAEQAACVRAFDLWKQQPESGGADMATAFARSNLIWVLVNHNDFLTIR